MKKYISIVILFIIILMQFAVVVQAADPCSISLKPSNQTLKQSDEFTVDITMSNITIDGGVTEFMALLDYPTDKLELIIDESEDAQERLASFEGTDYAEFKILYLGENDEDEAVLNPWTLLLLEGDTGVGILGKTTEPQKETQKIAKLKFKVKDDAASSSSEKITFEELTVQGASEESVTITNAYTTVKISGSQTISIGTSTNTSKNTSTNKNTNKNTTSVSNYNKTNTSVNKNVASQSTADEVPEAGTPIILPIILLFVGIVILKYKKYKEEYKNI